MRRSTVADHAIRIDQYGGQVGHDAHMGAPAHIRQRGNALEARAALI
jgi:hypothetical protein